MCLMVIADSLSGCQANAYFPDLFVLSLNPYNPGDLSGKANSVNSLFIPWHSGILSKRRALGPLWNSEDILPAALHVLEIQSVHLIEPEICEKWDSFYIAQTVSFLSLGLFLVL